MPYNIDFTQLADNSDYTLPDWSYPVGGARIVSGRWQAQWPEVYAYYTPPVATSGVMTVSLTQNGDEQMSGDVVSLGWCDAAGNGVVLRINGGFLTLYQLVTFTQTNEDMLSGVSGQVYPASTVFSIELDKDNGTLRALIDGVAIAGISTISSLSASDWKPVIASSWDNTASRGVTTLAVAGEAASNTPPVVDDQTFSVADSASNGTVIGTLVATDSDGTVDSYAISGSTLAIDSSGQITLTDNSGIVAGTPITATATVTDNNGDTDTATVTVNVTNSGLTFDCYDADNSNATITSETLSHVRVLDPADLSEVATATNISISGAGSAEIDTDSVTIGTDYLVIARRTNGDVCEPFLVSAIDLAAP